jgi:DNA primase catalytic subunit
MEYCPLAFDFDCATDISQAWNDCKKLVDHAVSVYELDINQEQMLVYFSGNRGFHVTINAECFDAKPMVDMIKVWRLVSEELFKELKLVTLDRAVYTRRRAWRVPNTKHGKTGLYKRALTYQELMSGVNKIKELAKSPCPWISISEVV